VEGKMWGIAYNQLLSDDFLSYSWTNTLPPKYEYFAYEIDDAEFTAEEETLEMQKEVLGGWHYGDYFLGYNADRTIDEIKFFYDTWTRKDEYIWTITVAIPEEQSLDLNWQPRFANLRSFGVLSHVEGWNPATPWASSNTA
jgi:hypothetical protein